MKKIFTNKRIIITCICLTSLVFIAYAANPGDEDDPLITLSYFNEKIDELKKSLSANGTEISPVEASSSFKLVNLKAGSTLICGEGAELIVRTGSMEAIASASGGLSDITLGSNISGGTIITTDHLLVIPRDDGRGIKALVGGAVMAKGKYTINSAD